VRYLVRLAAIAAVAALCATAIVFASIPALRTAASASHGVSEPIDLNALPQRSLVYDRNGNVAATLFADQNRSPVPLSQVPQLLRDSILAVEDENFYSHQGVNLRATLRALLTNVQSGEVQQGGSTITMQLVKNTLLTPERNFSRKTREAVLAWRLEQQMSKDEILERYLNTVYFGNGAYGVQAASELYFGKNVQDVTWPEAALLAALIRDPRDYDPFVNPALAVERRHIALQRLVETGKLSQQEADLYNFTPLPSAPSNLAAPPQDYFLEAVKQQLLDDPSFNLGTDYTERYNAVFEGGLRIYTTYDPVLQLKAVGARNDTLPGGVGDGLFVINNGRPDIPTTCPALNDGTHCLGTVAMVSVEPGTGAVRDVVGGPGFDKWKLDLATNKSAIRQPGSSMKAFVLAAALENGIDINDTINGGSCSIPNPGGTPNPYTQPGEGGVATLVRQTAGSVNCAFLRLGQIVGIDKVIAQARKMGITAPLRNVVSFPLGVNPVSPLEMAGAYAAIANDGVFNQPYFVDKITDANGKVIYQHTPSPTRVMSVQSAREETVALQAVVTGGTATRAQLPGRPAAGKTGTTDQHGDAWFIGFTPQLTTAVWMGSPESIVPMNNVGGINVFGGTFPALLWHNFMVMAMDGLPVIPFPPPGPSKGGTYLQMPFEKKSSSPSFNTQPTDGGTVVVTGPSSTEPPTTAPTTTKPKKPPKGGP